MPTFDEILDSYRPRYVAELAFSAAAGGSAAGYKKIYVMGERLSTGTMATNTVGTVPLTDADDAAAKFGAGSFGAWEAGQLFRGGGLKARVYPITVTEPAGVAASQTYIFALNAAANGVWTVNVAGTVFSFAVEAGDTPTEVGDKFVTAFNSLDVDNKPPCTPVNVAGTVTVTMNNKGAKGNTAPSYSIVTGQEPGTQTLTIATPVFAGGTLYPTLTTILAAMTTVVTPAIVHAWDESPDGSTKPMDLIRDHLITKCAAEVGMRGCMFTVITKTSATCLTDRTALDDNDAERCRLGCIALDTSTNSPGTWHASAGPYLAKLWGIKTDIAAPYNNDAMQFMVKPPDSGDILETTEVDTLLEGGLCVLNYDIDRDRYKLIKGIGARLFSEKPQAWAIVDASDWLRYNYLINLLAAFPSGTKLAQDGETNLDENTTTPQGILDVLHDTIFADNMKGILRNREDLWANAEAEISESVEGRVNAQGDHAVMMGLDIVATKLRQRAGYIVAEEG